ncbi:MAG: extracellular solute-binding protein [Clostridia bacterium]|nr:extracellular solute-binding protein [Clostridia bacterium]
MKKHLTRILSVLLIAVMMLSVLSACGEEEEKAGNDQVITGESDENPNIEAKDYGGHEFTFITNEGSSYNTRYLIATEDTGEVLGDALTKRNSALEQKYNITVKQMKVDNIVQSVRSAVMSGTIEFDAILASGPNCATMATEGLLYNLNSVERFDFSKSYWDSNACEQLAMGDKLYFTNCSMNIHSLGWIIFFNKYLIEEHDLTSPYELMEKNEWTVDNWAELAKAVTKDLNGDGQMTEVDRFGSLYSHADARRFAYGVGIRATTNNEEGKPVVTLLDDKTKIETLFSKLNVVFSNTECTYCIVCNSPSFSGYPHKYAYSRYLFATDHYLFMYDDATAVSALAEMEHEFGIIPFPKYDSNQENYVTQYPANYNMFALPALMPNAERTFNIIEDMNYFSSIILTPAWFDTLLTRRYTRDDESEASIRLLRENRVYDIGSFYDFGGIRTTIMDADVATNPNIVRNYERYKKNVQTAIDTTFNKFLENTNK